MEASKREQNKTKVRQGILKVSRKLFTANGYDDTMMKDIAGKAGVSKATVYNYFPNKESLLTGIEQELILQIEDMAYNNTEKLKSSEARLRQVLETLVQASAEYPDLAKFITYLNSCEDSALYAARLPLENLIRGLIKGAQNEGTFKKEMKVDQITDMIMGVFLITVFQWEHIDRYTPKQLKNKLNRTYKSVLANCFCT